MPAIIELRRARRGVVRHRGGLFERAAILEVGRDPRRAEGTIADLGGDASAGGAGTPIGTSGFIASSAFAADERNILGARRAYQLVIERRQRQLPPLREFEIGRVVSGQPEPLAQAQRF